MDALSEEINTLVTGRNDILHAFAKLVYISILFDIRLWRCVVNWRWREGTGYELGFRLNNKDDWPGP